MDCTVALEEKLTAGVSSVAVRNRSVIALVSVIHVDADRNEGHLIRDGCKFKIHRASSLHPHVHETEIGSRP